MFLTDVGMAKLPYAQVIAMGDGLIGPGSRLDPAAGRVRGHHPVQLPGDDPIVDVRTCNRLRQRVYPQTIRARSKLNAIYC